MVGAYDFKGKRLVFCSLKLLVQWESPTQEVSEQDNWYKEGKDAQLGVTRLDTTSDCHPQNRTQSNCLRAKGFPQCPGGAR